MVGHDPMASQKRKLKGHTNVQLTAEFKAIEGLLKIYKNVKKVDQQWPKVEEFI